MHKWGGEEAATGEENNRGMAIVDCEHREENLC